MTERRETKTERESDGLDASAADRRRLDSRRAKGFAQWQMEDQVNMSLVWLVGIQLRQINNGNGNVIFLDGGDYHLFR